MRRFLIAPALLTAGLGLGCDDASPVQEGPPPVGIVAEWAATHVNGGAVPDVLYLFDPELLDGKLVSVHITLDSARLVIREDGRYEHRIWASHWVGEPGGPPLERTLRFVHGDHGFWTEVSDEFRFESDWLQNHRMTGALDASGLAMRHGFTHGDPPVPVRYGRKEEP